MAAVNGNYGNPHGQNGIDGQHLQNGTQPSTQSATTETPEIPKDEVGWFFVEQYYTTLSRNPEKLFLFYNKRSQFVTGQEADKVAVYIGQRSINEKIKQLGYEDCKVRVTNVDSQASDSNIVIQVIGEISNKSQPHKKFVQTFVLATQTNGYFVLNDIFRYLVEEDELEEEEGNAAPVAETNEVASESAAVEPEASQKAAISNSAEPQGLTGSTDAEAIEKDAQAVDKHIEAKLLTPENSVQQPEPVENGISSTEPEVPAQDAADKEPAAEVPAASLATEKPTEPEPTPAISPLPQAAQPAEPVAAPKPSGPKSWASLAAAANRVATPVRPVAPAVPSAKPQSTTPTVTTTSAPVAASSTSADTPAKRDGSPASAQPDEWTAVGGAHARQQSRQVNTQQQQGPQNRAYIKNVVEGVDSDELKAHLEKFGEITYYDVNRPKNCAFVDFKTAESYQAAIAANPHVIGSERLFVEERRIRPAGAFGPGRGQLQNGRGGRGGQQGPNRGNFQNGPRGGASGGQQQARGGRGGPAPGVARGGRGGVAA